MEKYEKATDESGMGVVKKRSIGKIIEKKKSQLENYLQVEC